MNKTPIDWFHEFEAIFLKTLRNYQRKLAHISQVDMSDYFDEEQEKRYEAIIKNLKNSSERKNSQEEKKIKVEKAPIQQPSN